MCSGKGIGHWVTHPRSRRSIRALPVYAPAPACCLHPEQFLERRPTRIVVQHSRSLVEAACVPRVRESELLKIKMVAELMAQGAPECAERSDFFPHRRSHPDPDYHRLRRVISEKLNGATLANSQRSCCKNPDATGRNFVEL